MRSTFERTVQFGRDRFPLLIALLAGLGTVHILFRTATYGAAVNSDSVLHLSTAMNVLAGEGWRDFTGLKVVGWPPLFPLLLAALGGLGIDPLEAGRLVNAAAFGLTLLVAGHYLCSNLRSRGLALVASVALATSLPLSEFASSFLTEPLFVLFTLLALIQLAAGLNRKTAWTPLGWAAVFTALAVLTRYAGMVLIGTGVLLLLRVARLKQALVFGVCSSAPLLAVLAHNWTVYRSGDNNYDPFFENDLVVYGRLTEEGEGRGSGQSLADGLSQIVEVFYAWVVPPNAPDEVAYLLWLAVGLASAVVVLHATRMRSDSRRHDPEAAPPFCGLGPVLPFGVFALIYLVFMLVAIPFTVGYGIGSRYLLPVYAPLLLAAVFVLDRFLSIKATGRMAAARYGTVSLVLLGTLAHIGYSVHRNLTITANAWVAGFGLHNNAYTENSDILNYLSDGKNRIDGKIFSNAPYLAWFWDRTAPPGKYAFLPHKLNLMRDILGWAGDDSAYILLIWYYTSNPDDHDHLDIRLLPGVEVVAERSDGVIFRMTAGPRNVEAARHRLLRQRYVHQLIQQAQAGGERVVSSAGWSVYRNERTLTYHKQPCAPADTQAKFTLEIFSDDPADLPADRQPYGSTWTDFHFHRRGGIRVDDQCVMSIQLPAYAIGRVRVGQWSPSDGRTLWEVDFAEAR